MSIYRSHRAGLLRSEHVGCHVMLAGWVRSIRRFRRHAFVELREETGCVQLFVHHLPSGVSEECAIVVEGVVRARLSPHPNLAAYPTGEVEVEVVALRVEGPCGLLPFGEREQPSEEQLLRHRTVALRRGEVRERLVQRSLMVKAMREVVENEGFLEIETPVLVRNTPGGANAFVVPLEEGRSYALAQSPQTWKQLLVCGGFERYYQLAHCFRNEGARPGRQPEFSQFEIEMAWAGGQDVMTMMEAVVKAAGQVAEVTWPQAFVRCSYLEAMSQWGSEQPHLGNPLRLQSPLAQAQGRFEQAQVRLELPRSMTEHEQSTWRQALESFMGRRGHVESTGCGWVVHGPLELAQQALGALRDTIGLAWGLVQPGLFPIWVHTFPVFERNELGVMVASHHPFTRPLPEHTSWLRSSPMAMLGTGFDLVINGVEVGGGSERIAQASLQRQVLEVLRLPKVDEHFRPLLEALALGAPPHAGMALGVERLVATLVGASSIREVMPFPKTTTGQCLFTQALC